LAPAKQVNKLRLASKILGAAKKEIQSGYVYRITPEGKSRGGDEAGGDERGGRDGTKDGDVLDARRKQKRCAMNQHGVL
jgi:hypothetical protein